MKAIKGQSGLTLLELLISLAIVLILTTSALPALSKFLSYTRSQALYAQLFGAIQYTREKAAFSGKTAILCPSTDNIHCDKDWSKPLIIFLDTNNNQQRDQDEVIEKHYDLLKHNERIVWRAFGHSHFMRFMSDGSTGYQSGNLSICLSDKEYIQQIKLYRSGRARKSRQDELVLKNCY